MTDLPNDIEHAYKYCESITRKHAKSFYFAAKFLPRYKRKPIYAIYALCRHVDDEIDEAEVSSDKEAIEAIEVWKRKLSSIYSGKIKKQNTKNKSQNFVLTAWRDLLKTYKIKQELPLDLIKGVLSDTRTKRYENFEELYVYCYRVASTVGLMSSEIFGYKDQKTLEYAESLGIAMQITNILRDIKEDAAMNRIYLPQKDLQAFGVSEEQIFANQPDENFVRLMKFEIERARNYYAKAEKGISLLEKDARFTVLLAARLYAKILDEIEKQDYNIFKTRAHTSKTRKFFAVPKIWFEAKFL